MLMALGRLKVFRTDLGFGATFLVTRLAYHAWGMYVCLVRMSCLRPFAFFLLATWGLHIYWGAVWVSKRVGGAADIRRRAGDKLSPTPPLDPNAPPPPGGSSSSTTGIHFRAAAFAAAEGQAASVAGGKGGAAAVASPGAREAPSSSGGRVAVEGLSGVAPSSPAPADTPPGALVGAKGGASAAGASRILVFSFSFFVVYFFAMVFHHSSLQFISFIQPLSIIYLFCPADCVFNYSCSYFPNIHVIESSPPSGHAIVPSGLFNSSPCFSKQR